MSQKFALIVIAATLSGCFLIVGNSQSNGNLSKEISEWSYFTLQSSEDFSRRIVRPDKSVALLTFDNRTMDRRSDDWSIFMFPNESVAVECTPFALGSSNLEKHDADGVPVWWGKVDRFDHAPFFMDEGQQEFCTPLQGKYQRLPEDVHEGALPRIDESDAYILCSEKDGKRVVICVQQMTDNPELTQEIFSSFRWAK